MRRVPTRKDLLRKEGGFTLPEVLVAMVMMVTVMFALYAIFDMSLRVFSFGNDKIEAVENARAGLERMEREIRAAYPVRNDDQDTLFFDDTGSDTIVFRNDRDADWVAEEDEKITYEVSDTTLLRNSRPVVENVSSLTFDYQDRQGNSLDPATQLAQTEIVEITLEIEVDGGNSGTVTQNLNTDVALRNRVE